MNIILKSKLSYILLFIVLTMNSTVAKNHYNSGFKQIEVVSNNRVLSVAVWYPTLTSQPIENIGDNAIFEGEPAINNALIAEGKHPLIMISHGLGGSWMNQIWLASALSKQGYIVASPNHPGTSSDNMNRTIAQNMLERPKDISQTITNLLLDKTFSLAINAKNIAIIGHSYGGWTAIEAIGGLFSTKQFNRHCKVLPDSISCVIFKKQMQGLSNHNVHFKLNKIMQDKRIKTAIILDTSFSYGFTPTSLAKINIPVLIISSSPLDKTQFDNLDSLYLIKNLPKKLTKSVAINGASHFSFIGICKKNAIELLAQKTDNEKLICQQEGNSRVKIHYQLIDSISNWLNTNNIN